MSTGLLVLVAALWGAGAGVLLPRAAYRFSVPEGEGWRERCPGGHPLPGRGEWTGWIGWTRWARWTGWIGRARCGECAGGRTYGPRAALLATVTGLVCAALAAATDTRPELGVWLLLAPVGVLLTVVDFRVRRLPNPLTLTLAVAAPTLLGLVALVPEHAGDWTTALWATLALGAGYYALYRINPGGMGFGDVKLALGAGAVLGWYGWSTVMLGTLAGFLSGALYGWALVILRRVGRKTAIPFGPFLIGGAFVGLLIGAYAA